MESIIITEEEDLKIKKYNILMENGQKRGDEKDRRVS